MRMNESPSIIMFGLFISAARTSAQCNPHSFTSNRSHLSICTENAGPGDYGLSLLFPPTPTYVPDKCTKRQKFIFLWPSRGEVQFWAGRPSWQSRLQIVCGVPLMDMVHPFGLRECIWKKVGVPSLSCEPRDDHPLTAVEIRGSQERGCKGALQVGGRLFQAPLSLQHVLLIMLYIILQKIQDKKVCFIWKQISGKAYCCQCESYESIPIWSYVRGVQILASKTDIYTFVYQLLCLAIYVWFNEFQISLKLFRIFHRNE